MTTVLENVDIASEAFKSLVWDIYIRKLIVKIIAFFGLGATSLPAVILTKIAIHYAEKAYPIFKKAFKVGSIVLTNEIHQKAYERASLKLKIIAMRSGINSDEFKNERQIEHDKQSKLVIFNIQYAS